MILMSREEGVMLQPPPKPKPKDAPAEPSRSRPVLGAAAYHGIAGEIANLVDQTSEADPPASLVQLLACVGNAVGNTPHWRVGDEEHRLNLFVAVVGPTGTGRKGTSLSPVRRLVAEADPDWVARITGGLSSGEGLIHFVRDPSKELNKDKRPVDEGEPDKRCMPVEGELASVFGAAARQGNTLSMVLRNAWDGSTLRITTKNSPAVATGAHVTVIGHITPAELHASFSDVDAKNGLGNRFLWVYSESKKLMPQGGRISIEDRERIANSLRDVIHGGKHRVSEMLMSEAAWEVWGRNDSSAGTMYARLNHQRRGLAEHLCSRAASQVRRIACIYALLDKSPDVEPVHLHAAEAVWNYCEETVRFIFGNALGNALAEDILAMLRDCDGVSRNDIREYFSRNKRAKDIEAALDLLRSNRLADFRLEKTERRPKEIWFAIEQQQAAA